MPLLCVPSSARQQQTTTTNNNKQQTTNNNNESHSPMRTDWWVSKNSNKHFLRLTPSYGWATLNTKTVANVATLFFFHMSRHLLDRCTWPNSFAWFFSATHVWQLLVRLSQQHTTQRLFHQSQHTHTHLVETHTHPAQKVLLGARAHTHTFMGSLVFVSWCVCVCLCVCRRKRRKKQNRCTRHVLRQSRRRRRRRSPSGMCTIVSGETPHVSLGAHYYWSSSNLLRKNSEYIVCHNLSLQCVSTLTAPIMKRVPEN